MKEFRKYRTTGAIRDLYAETRLNIADFIVPLFIVEGEGIRVEIPSLVNVYHLSVDKLYNEINTMVNKGVNKVLLFGVQGKEKKDGTGSIALLSDNLVSRAICEIKKKFPNVIVFTDVCLCGYTDHGHCGVLKNNDVDNKSTLPLLAKMALTHAMAGADFVAPSAMMDGQVAAIRKELDDNSFKNVQIMSYSAKYASSFYGPFRDAAGSSPAFGDRKSYQMDFRNSDQAMGEIEADISEGADIVMIKPAHTYLDIISRAFYKFSGAKIAAYHVSGEYMLLKNAAMHGLVDEERAFNEVLTSLKRAGSNYIISYYIPDNL